MQLAWVGALFVGGDDQADLAAEWDNATGRLVRDMLDVRDRRLAADDLYPSRVTGMAMIMVPFLQHDLGHDGPPFVWGEDYRAALRAELDAFSGYVAATSAARGERAPVNEAVLRLAERVEQGDLVPSPENAPHLIAALYAA